MFVETVSIEAETPPSTSSAATDTAWPAFQQPRCMTTMCCDVPCCVLVRTSRAEHFTTCKGDRPLFVQFCANNPEIFVASAALVQVGVVGIAVQGSDRGSITSVSSGCNPPNHQSSSCCYRIAARPPTPPPEPAAAAVLYTVTAARLPSSPASQ